jgi:hypothetical protein
MPLQGNDPKQRHWENVSLPVIGTVIPGTYSNPLISVDEYGRIISVSAGGGTGSVAVQNSSVTLPTGPFSILNFTGAGVVASPGLGGIVNISVPGGAFSAQDEGIPIGGGPFGVLNFVGGGVVAAVGSPGVLDVTVSTSSANAVEFRKALVGTGLIQNVGTPVPPASILHAVSVTIITPYSPGAVLEVRDGGGAVLMASALINPQLTGTYTLATPGNNSFFTNPQILLIVSGGPVVGAGVVDIIYQKA